MALDNAKNFAKGTLSTGYTDASTSIVLTTGHGARFPTPPFNAVWWNATDYADPADDPNKEIVRVTNIATDTLTVTRAQESTSASTKNTAGKTYLMIAGPTAKLITDIDTAIGAAGAPSYTFIMAGECYSDATMSRNSQGWSNYPTCPLPDNASKVVTGSTRTPAGKTGISSIRAYYYGAGVDAGNIVCEFSTAKLDPGSAGNTLTGDSTTTQTTIAGTQNGIGFLDFPADSFNAIGTIAENYLIGVQFSRLGANGSDTYSSSIDFLGFKINWS